MGNQFMGKEQIISAERTQDVLHAKNFINSCAQETVSPLLPTPAELCTELPLSPALAEQVQASRAAVRDILEGLDQRLLVIVGPCSIHDDKAALEYAQRLQRLREALGEQLLILMRCYFEKPRTSLGWKGMINDPDLDGSCHIAKGARLARSLLLEIGNMGLGVATETLEPNLALYYQDLISWTAIGARTAESQLHRQFASGAPSPVGIKNGTNGSIEAALNALEAASAAHTYVGVDTQGRLSLVQTQGNPACHLVLRGGENGPNYQEEVIAECGQQLKARGLNTRVLVDCSHANSSKRAPQQAPVLEDVVRQIRQGNKGIAGVMLESHLQAGQQPLVAGTELAYGVSITDECLGWQQTEQLLRATAEALS